MPGRRQQPPMKKPYMSGGGHAALAAALAAHDYAAVDPKTCTATLPSWSCHSESYRSKFNHEHMGGGGFWRTLFGRRRSNKVAPAPGRRPCIVIKAANRMPELVDADDERMTGTTWAGGHVTTGEGLPAAYHVLRRVAVGLK
ncbi:hypothetical protein PLESTB_000690500 [Pleodorina starrii]|uniref:Uncharacterized protein n=1 Tax=Pleodorina starrii TaxID=330485 RepID=A0A9W6BJG8_9CHLO|nr:hypothetical protein PLESTM_001226700 [Pleodorina starrii]GLC52940.1 hypothetical protein PLESTB_000690500 [Pleodorina starrii]